MGIIYLQNRIRMVSSIKKTLVGSAIVALLGNI